MQASSDTRKATKLAELFLSSEPESIQNSWKELRDASFQFSKDFDQKHQQKLGTIFNRLNLTEKQKITEIFNKVYDFNFTFEQFKQIVYSK
uniref:Uncharacterized protein n=1 Tax=Panagrolaimus sp. JU765 TaxID=591449 RepID=A0AC34QUN0_9BILA